MRIAIIGKGALGLLYGDILTSAYGADAVTFVMDKVRLLRHAGAVYTINGRECHFRDATAEQLGPVDLVMVATKATGLASALDEVGPLLGADTVIVSVLNGVRSEEVIAARFGWGRVVPCVAQGMDAARYGTSLSYAHVGELHIGRFERTPEASYLRVRDLLSTAGVPLVEEADIRYRMWAKFVMNVGINQCCAVYGVPYGGVIGDREGEPWRTFIAAMREVVAVGQAEGVALTEANINEAVRVEASLDQASTPSMGQDRINRVPSEVDEFAGEVMRRAARHGIYVPANEWLYRRMRQIEAGYGAGPEASADGAKGGMHLEF